MNPGKLPPPLLSGQIGTVTFVAVMLTLEQLQPGYSSANQLVSELATGPHGRWMLLAFAGIAWLTAETGRALHYSGQTRPLPGLLYAAAVCFLGAGIFRLGEATLLHTTLVGVAFTLCGTSMYLLPRTTGGRQLPFIRGISWGLGLLMAGSIAQPLFPVGVAERLAALAWMLWAGTIAFMLQRQTPKYGKPAIF